MSEVNRVNGGKRGMGRKKQRLLYYMHCGTPSDILRQSILHNGESKRWE
jgi:hypothetical protein